MSKTALLICDLQTGFSTKIHQFGRLERVATRMLAAASILQLPVLLTEQNPARLGATVSVVTAALPSIKPTSVLTLPKMSFSMLDLPAARAFLQQHDIDTVALLGIEAHICVLQTALDALQLQRRVYLLTDGISSQRSYDVHVALTRLQAEGARLCTSESFLFELLRSAEHPRFRDISALVKASADSIAAYYGQPEPHTSNVPKVD